MTADAKEIIRRLRAAYHGVKVPLRHSTPMELLVATILSAQCTDERVNQVTEKIFKKYRSIEDFANASQKDLESDVRSCGFYRNKAKNIIAAAKMVCGRFGGKVPRTMEEILELPGVARKTANIVLGSAYGVIEGIAVDTHVRRLSLRLGLTRHEEPEKIEIDLMKLVPRSDWFDFPLLLQKHGREVCTARSPRHEKCVLRDICPSRDI